MFCPRCATQNLDDVKFCRGCGTNLEIVSLALSGQQLPSKSNNESKETWLQMRRRGVSSLVRATGLLGSSLLIGAALGLFSNQNDWIIIWMVFCGWMAVWGVFSLVSGVQALLESRYVREEVRETPAPAQLWNPAPPQQLPDAVSGLGTTIPTSVTEHTTRALAEPPAKNKTD
ncbi:MAG TPA: zinc-ribbon domain-containing protein [Pyrinomonadaceae bacterium]|nr:zinc-ribbon domain-containing protein [Pyrinomonadaceae bacterium]